ncbi:MAG: DMT family transporter [Gammaproteobacteria bacterium]|nr:DMT family transporter [Gammaproteobacteria bacterium]
MKNVILYLSTVLIWGSTWLAIEFQLGHATVYVSVFYRFAIAATLMWLACLALRVPMRLTIKDQAFVGLMALFNFSLNYVLIYQSQEYLTSAMTCIVFSTMLLMNIINTRLFFGDHIDSKVYTGAFFGLIGLVVLFWDDLSWGAEAGLQTNSWLGLGFGLAAALIASLGNMVSVRNSRAGVSVFAANAWGMLYGTLALGLIILVNGTGFAFSFEPSYVGSLIYLATLGTVVAFATYYMLLNNIGPEKASYTIVLFPVVAVALSTIFEDFSWTSYTFVGFILVLVGNAIILAPKRKIDLAGSDKMTEPS